MNPYTTYSSSPINKAKPMSNALPSYTSKKSQATDMTSNPLKPSSKPTPRKKRPAPSNVDNEDEEASAAAQFALGGITTKSPRKKKAKNEESEEKRLRRFRARPPVSFTERLQRARTQRMFLIERTRQVSDDGMHAEEVLDIAGTTGNVYQVTVSKVPSCSCPDAAKGNQCKHIVYVMVNILKAPEHLSYQLALLSTELNQIFSAAPITQQSQQPSRSHTHQVDSTDTGGVRKTIEGDCPVCVMPFEEGEDLVWCKAACGQNIHRTCFQQWQRSKSGQMTKCVYCRSEWKVEAGDLSGLKGKVKEGVKNGEGYVNVAGELGMSGERDMSSYHSYWVARQRRWY